MVTYEIGDTDMYHPVGYPEVVYELTAIGLATMHMPLVCKAAITISYYKDHCINTEWIKLNPQFASLIISNYYCSIHVEQLFAACRKNTRFLQAFEYFINEQVFMTKY